MAPRTRFREWLTRQAAQRGPGLALFVFVLALCLLSALEVIFHARLDDFLSFYAAAHAAATDVDLYDQRTLARLTALHGWGERVYPYLYPPFLAHALRPLALLDLPTAHRLWLAVSVVAFAGAISAMLLGARRSWRTVTPRRAPSYGLLLALAAVLVWALPLRNNLLLGQVNPLVLLFVSFAVRAELLGRRVRAGLWLAPAVMIKMTPAVLLLFFVVRRDLRTPLACCAGLTALAALSLGLGAGPDWQSFLRHAPGRGYGATIAGLFSPDTVWNFAPAGWFIRVFPEHVAWVPRFCLLVLAGACSITAWLSIRARATSRDGLALASAFPALLLASPLTYVHHVVYTLPALVIWLLRTWSERRHALFGATLLAAFVAGTDWAPMYPRLFGASPSPLLTSINLYAVLLFAAVGWALLSQDRRSAAVRASTPRGGLSALLRPRLHDCTASTSLAPPQGASQAELGARSSPGAGDHG